MMTRWWHYLLLGLCAWLLFMVWRLPAGVAYAMAPLPQELPLKFAGLHDTVWQGGAQQIQYQDKRLASGLWELSPWGLMVGQVDVGITLLNDDSYLEAQLEMPIGGGDLSFSDVEGRMPVSQLQQLLATIPLPLEGELSLKLDKLVVTSSGQLQRAEGRVVWYKAGVQLAEKLQFGDLQMTLHSRDEGVIEGLIHDSGGPLQLQATLTLSPDGSYQLQGQVKANETAAPALQNSLAMLGKPDSQGRYPLNFRGRL
jgi:general secretion pathway protein N